MQGNVSAKTHWPLEAFAGHGVRHRVEMCDVRYGCAEHERLGQRSVVGSGSALEELRTRC